ncbi:MAG: hypothetical protein ACYCY7_14455, partial [Gallionella sp.]
MIPAAPGNILNLLMVPPELNLFVNFDLPGGTIKPAIFWPAPQNCQYSPPRSVLANINALV